MKVASTSIEVYHGEIKGKKENSQDKTILLAFNHIGQPATYRMIQALLKSMGIDWEVNVISRSINNLKGGVKQNKPILIEWVMDDQCPITKRKSQFYQPIGIRNNNQLGLF